MISFIGYTDCFDCFEFFSKLVWFQRLPMRLYCTEVFFVHQSFCYDHLLFRMCQFQDCEQFSFSLLFRLSEHSFNFLMHLAVRNIIIPVSRFPSFFVKFSSYFCFVIHCALRKQFESLWSLPACRLTWFQYNCLEMLISPFQLCCPLISLFLFSLVPVFYSVLVLCDVVKGSFGTCMIFLSC